jgi:hypothetical protein
MFVARSDKQRRDPIRWSCILAEGGTIISEDGSKWALRDGVLALIAGDGITDIQELRDITRACEEARGILCERA